MGFFDKAKQFMGGKSMANVTITVIERQPAGIHRAQRGHQNRDFAGAAGRDHDLAIAVETLAALKVTEAPAGREGLRGTEAIELRLQVAGHRIERG